MENTSTSLREKLTLAGFTKSTNPDAISRFMSNNGRIVLLKGDVICPMMIKNSAGVIEPVLSLETFERDGKVTEYQTMLYIVYNNSGIRVQKIPSAYWRVGESFSEMTPETQRIVLQSTQERFVESINNSLLVKNAITEKRISDDGRPYFTVRHNFEHSEKTLWELMKLKSIEEYFSLCADAIADEK